jgi:hypothetical protein
MAEREHAVFEAAHAVETPLSIDDGLGALTTLGMGSLLVGVEHSDWVNLAREAGMLLKTPCR